MLIVANGKNYYPPKGNDVYFRVSVNKGGLCQFSYSLDGTRFIGLFATRTTTTNDSGYADFDWFRMENNL